TNTRPCATTGLDQPRPTGARHVAFNPSAGKDSMMPVSLQTPSRSGPRHCGQSACMADVSDNDMANPIAHSMNFQRCSIECSEPDVRCGRALWRSDSHAGPRESTILAVRAANEAGECLCREHGC